MQSEAWWKGLWEEVVLRSFPELQGWNVNVNFVSRGGYFAAIAEDIAAKTVNLRIGNSTAQSIGRKEATGLLAHEISHAVANRKNFALVQGHCKRKDFRRAWLIVWKMLSNAIFEKKKQANEEATDLMAIERGYGEHLLAFCDYAEFNDERYNGLPPSAIQLLTRKKAGKK